MGRNAGRNAGVWGSNAGFRRERVARAWARCLVAAAALAVLAPPPARAAEAERDAPTSAMVDSDALFSDDFELELDTEVRDPLEPVNRSIFRGNQFVDRVLIDPATRAYRWALPEFARRSVRGVFENLSGPGVVVNDLLQGEGEKARDAGARFVVNTTLGVAGLWDPAQRMGLEAHSADFGQTLGKAGVGSGPYLVLPLFGPNTTRDLVGDVVDLAMRPDTWLLPLGSRLVLGSTDGISIKDANLEAIDALEESSIDFYIAMRSAYLMNREAMVSDSGAVPSSDEESLYGDAPLSMPDTETQLPPVSSPSDLEEPPALP